ncbi:MAG TPA: hypothetical protein VMW32_05510 [Bacteroidales bacterium]|nr:hypothetical protein [Bacteroidales bacterium]
MTSFDLTMEQRVDLLETIIPEHEDYNSNTAKLRVTPPAIFP